MWTMLATPNKMVPAVIDLCAGLVVFGHRQFCRFCRGLFSLAVPDWSFRSCLHVRRLLKATNRRKSTITSLIFPSANIITSMSNFAVKALVSLLQELLDKAVSNFFFEPSLNEKFGLWKIPIGNYVHLNLTSMCRFSLNPLPPPPPLQESQTVSEFRILVPFVICHR